MNKQNLKFHLEQNDTFPPQNELKGDKLFPSNWGTTSVCKGHLCKMGNKILNLHKMDFF